MQTKTFTYSARNQRNTGLKFLILAVVGAGLAVYMWLWADPINLTVLVGGVFLCIMGLAASIKLMLAPNKENQTAIAISDKGLIANTTPVAKAAGLIEWIDIVHIQFSENLFIIKVKEPEKYATKMKSFFVRDTFVKTLRGSIKVSTAETNVSNTELQALLQQYVPFI